MIWNENHPERDQPDLRAYSWKQAAELALVDAEQAATLLTLYELATDADTAMSRGVTLEAARADAAAELRRQAAERSGWRQIAGERLALAAMVDEMAELSLGPLPPRSPGA